MYYTLFFIRTHFIRTWKLRLGKKIRTNQEQSEATTKWSSDYVQQDIDLDLYLGKLNLGRT